MKLLSKILDTEIPPWVIEGVILGAVLSIYWHVMLTEQISLRTALIVRDMRSAVLASAASGARESE